MRLLCLIQLRLGSERGFAVPIVLLALVAASGLAAAAVVASVTSQGGSVRDQNTKAALAVAESGVADALMRFNQAPPGSDSSVCEPVGNGGVAAGGWCPTRLTGAIDRGTYAYSVQPSVGELQVVSTGEVDGVTRRIEVRAHSAPHQPFGSYGVIGLDHITQESNAEIYANAATNGDITLSSNAKLHCEDGGGAQVGEGRDVIGSSNYEFSCPEPEEGFLTMSPVNQGDVATDNDNERITLAKQSAGGGDTISGNPNGVDWDPAARTLALNANTSLTLGGANYSLCRLTLGSNTNLFTVGGTPVRIWFDSPEACSLPSGSHQLEMSSNASIEATGSSPGDLALLFVGSESLQTRITLSSNTEANGPCDQSFVLYAPRTDLEMASNSHICGALAAKSITAASNATVRTSNLATDFELPNTPPHYSTDHPGTFVECSTTPPAPPAAPDEGC